MKSKDYSCGKVIQVFFQWEKYAQQKSSPDLTNLTKIIVSQRLTPCLSDFAMQFRECLKWAIQNGSKRDYNILHLPKMLQELADQVFFSIIQMTISNGKIKVSFFSFVRKPR